jgi:hypothetical protein
VEGEVWWEGGRGGVGEFIWSGRVSVELKKWWVRGRKGGVPVEGACAVEELQVEGRGVGPVQVARAHGRDGAVILVGGESRSSGKPDAVR